MPDLTQDEQDPFEPNPNLFDPDAPLPEDLDEDDEYEKDETDEDDEPEIVEPEVIPDLPVLLFYDSATHGKRRYYKNSLNGKPEWSYTKDDAFVFDNLDHLKLAGGNCKQYGYQGLDFESVK